MLIFVPDLVLTNKFTISTCASLVHFLIVLSVEECTRKFVSLALNFQLFNSTVELKPHFDR